MSGRCRGCGGAGQQGARFCPACGTALPGAHSGGVRKTVTVLFADVLGRSGLAERLDPEVLRRLDSEVHAAVRAVLESHGATVEKYAGDAAMAVFGVPVAREDDAQRAGAAALAVVRETAAVLDRVEAASGVRLALRAALDTGEVLADGGDQGLVVGEAVVVAARLLQHASAGEVLLGPGTATVLGPTAGTAEPRQLALRGRDDTVRTVRLLSVAPTHAASHDRGRHAPLLGRATEQVLLAATLDRAVRGPAGHLVTVLGEAGLGKSRLVDEFLASAVSSGAFVRRVRCRSYGARVRWSPLPDLLDGLPTDVVPADAARVLEALTGHGPAASPAEAAWAMSLVLRWLAEQAPCVVVLEDLHGAEPEVLEVVQDVARRIADLPVVVLATARPTLSEACPSWGAGLRHVLSLALHPLSPGDSRRQAELLLAPAVAPPAVLDQAVEAAGGNPLFLEQVVSVLVESGRLRREGSTWQVQGDPGTLDIPPTVAALLAARLDRLPPAERHVLERGALLGKQFAVGDLRDLVDDGLRDELDGLLGALLRRELLRGTGAKRWFSSSLVREAAYGGLPRAERARLHERVGRELAALPGREELAGGHLEEAVRHRTGIGDEDVALRDVAADLLAQAGTRALTGDAAAAAALLRRSTALRDADDPRRLLLETDVARATVLTGDLAGAEALLRDTLVRAERGGHRREAAHARLALMDLLRSTHPEDSVRRIPPLVAEVLPLLRSVADDRGLSLAYQLQAAAHQYRVRWAAMEDPLERALLHAHRARDTRLAELAQSLLVGSLFHGPTPAGEVRRRLEDMVEAPGASRPHRASVSARLAGTQALQGEVDAAVDRLAEVRDVLTSLGRQLSAAATAFVLGPVLLLGDEPERAATELDAACRRLSAMGDRAYASTLLALLAEAHWRCGDVRAAQAALDACRAAGADSDVITQLRWRAVQAKLDALAGRAAPARDHADRAVALAARTDELTSQGDVLADRAEVLLLLGDEQAAARDLHDAVLRYERKGAVQAVRRLAPRRATGWSAPVVLPGQALRTATPEPV